MPASGADIQLFVFDLFGVILSFDNDVVYARLARHCADPRTAFDRLHGIMASHDVITGVLSLPEIHQRLVDAHGLSLTYPDFREAWLEPYSEAMPGMADLVRALATHYPVALLSNVDRYYFEVVRARNPELGCFDPILLSCDLGLAKPDPRIFRHVCDATGAEPSQCYFVDDVLVNVEAARALGFQTHWFHGVAGLLRELRLLSMKGV